MIPRGERGTRSFWRGSAMQSKPNGPNSGEFGYKKTPARPVMPIERAELTQNLSRLTSGFNTQQLAGFFVAGGAETVLVFAVVTVGAGRNASQSHELPPAEGRADCAELFA